MAEPLVGILVGSESDRERMRPALDEPEPVRHSDAETAAALRAGGSGATRQAFTQPGAPVRWQRRPNAIPTRTSRQQPGPRRTDLR